MAVVGKAMAVPTGPPAAAPVVLWLLVLLLASLPALRVGQVVQGGADAVTGSDPVVAVDRAVAAGVAAGNFYPFVTVLHSDAHIVSDPAFAGAGRAITAALRSRGGAVAVQSVWNTGDAALVGRSGHTALLLVSPDAASFGEAERDTGRLRDALASVPLPAGFGVEVTGQPAALYDLDRRSSADLLAAERVGLPLVLLILLLVFRSPVAALLPLTLAASAVTLALAALWLVSAVTTVSVFAENTVTMIGLGVGVDYSLLLLVEFRRLLAAGEGAAAAARNAAHAVRGTVLCSGTAVAIGFLALCLVRLPFLKALAFGGVVVVAAAVLATLTLLPALLAWLGGRVNWPRAPVMPVRPIAPVTPVTPITPDRGGFWDIWARMVMRRPWLWCGAALVILALLAQPVLRLQGWSIGGSTLAGSLESRRGYELLRRDFAPGWMGPAAIIFEAPPGHEAARGAPGRAIGALAMRLKQDPRVRLVRLIPDAPGSQGRVALLTLVGRDPPESAQAAALVHDLRARLQAWPEAGVVPRVTGTAALLVDFDAEVFGRLRLVIAVVLAVTFMVLLLHLRSVLLPLKAIALNLASVLASFGFLVLVFQDGHGAHLLGLAPPGGINAFVVLMLFTVLFGLSMDYEVFLLDAIRREFARTGDNAGAVARGIAATGGLVTSAAAIMVCLFASFGFTELMATRQFGLGLAFAVALDATVIRLVLLPALMTLLGRANWWLPGRAREGVRR